MKSEQRPLVGRERELGVLRDALMRVREERSPQLVTLVGVPGIGKRRLVYELSRIVDADPDLITWRQGRCLPYGEGVSFWALAEMVKAQAGILESDHADLAAEKLRGTVDALVDSPDEAVWLERHLRPLVGLGTEEATGSDRRGEAFAAWRRFFESLAEQRPLVLVFEDLHWADDGLLDFVDHLVDWASGCADSGRLHRAARAARAPAGLGRRQGERGHDLAPGARGRRDRPAGRRARRAPGPPCRPAARAARPRGRQPRCTPSSTLAMLAERGDLDEHSLPETVQGIIAARLDGLAADEKELLQDAAVIGKVFWLGALAQMEDAVSFELEERLHALERKEFVRRERRPSIAGEGEYAFRHLLVRDVAYGQIPRARAHKHRRLAEWLETVAPDRSEDQAEMLAHHYVATLELSKAAGVDVSALADPARLALAEAGDRAMALSAPEPARRFYAAALELVPEESYERANLLLRQARSLAGVMSDEGMTGLREAIPTLLASGDVQAVAEAEAALADGSWHWGARAVADEHAARAAELVAGDRPSPTMLAVLASRSRPLLVGGEGREAVAVAREGFCCGRRARPGRLSGTISVTIGAARGLLGDFGGLADLEEGLAVAQAAKMPGTIQRAYANLAELNRRMGRGAEAAAMLAAGRESNERYGHRTGLLWMDGEEAVDRLATEPGMKRLRAEPGAPRICGKLARATTTSRCAGWSGRGSGSARGQQRGRDRRERASRVDLAGHARIHR